MTSYNRNFAGINDGNPNTHGFVVSPEVMYYKSGIFWSSAVVCVTKYNKANKPLLHRSSRPWLLLEKSHSIP
jgi:aconitase A